MWPKYCAGPTPRTLSPEDEFVAACARADGPAARAILAANPGMFERLSEAQLRQLPNLMEARKFDAVRLMVELGWPIAVRGGDWGRFRVEPSRCIRAIPHGRDSFSSTAPAGPKRTTTATFQAFSDGLREISLPDPDWVGCARALVEHGMPIPESSQDYSAEVGAYFATSQRGIAATKTTHRRDAESR